MTNGKPHGADSLEDLGFQNFSIVTVSTELKGGASQSSGDHLLMVDVFNNSAIRDTQFQPSPHWRWVQHGFVAEGKCKLGSCVAYQEWVCCSKRFGVFDLKSLKCTCPMCGSSVKLNNVLFNNCLYLIRVVKAGTSEQLQVPWTKVGGRFFRTWNKQIAGVTSWKFIQVISCPLHQASLLPDGSGYALVASVCTICFKKINNNGGHLDARLLECIHSFHQSCWNEWWQKRRSGGQQINCPLCAAKL